jgi:hypothetical protein
VNFTDFYETEPEDAGLSLPYIMSAADYHAHEKYVPVIKDPSSAYVKKKEGRVWLYLIFLFIARLVYTRKNAQVVTSLQTSCYKSVHKLSTSCVRTACSQLF